MLTKEQYDALKLKKVEELKDEEKVSMLEYEQSIAESKNTGVPTTWEEIFKHPRFKELDQKAKDATKALADFQTASQEAEKTRLQEQGDYKKLYEQEHAELLKIAPRAQFAEESEKTLQAVLAAQVNEIPETYRKLVPSGLSTIQQLDWIAENKALLLKPKGFDINAGKLGGGSLENEVEFSAEQQEVFKAFGEKPEDLAKYAK